MPESPVTPAWLERIKVFEGFRAKAYQDVVGVWTIGYGSTRGVKPGDVTDEPRAAARLSAELVGYLVAVLKLCPVELTRAELDALVDFAYNLGASKLRASTLRQKLLRGEHSDAAEEFRKWVYAGGRVQPGLVIRRLAERARFLEGVSDD